jgi:cytochrome c556
MRSLLKPFLGVVLMAGVAATAQAQAPFAKMEDAVKYRKNALFVMSQHFGRLGPVVKGERPYDKDEVARNVAIAEQMSHLPWAGFVAGSDKGETRAKPEIWTEAAKYKAASDKLEQEMGKLSAAAKSGDLNAIKAQFGEVGKSCKGCHDAYRKE